MKNRKHEYALVPLLVGLGLGTAASAQEAKESAELPEITVTAQKRATAASETPISISAVSGDELVDRGIANFTGLAAETPGVSLHTNGPGQTEIEMRGMTSSGGNSPTVGFYLDDVPLTAPASAQNGKIVIDPSLYDLNRVEVLRGPQGTLYGSGSMGGTVRLITNQPDARSFGGSAQVTLSGTEGGGFNHAENAALNVPLIKDELAARLVLSQASTSGWIDRVVLGNFPEASNGGLTRGNVSGAPVIADHKDVNSETLKGGRLTLAWKPTDRLTITPSVFYQHIGQAGESAYDSVPGNTLAHYQPFDIAEPLGDTVEINNVSINYRFDDFDITSVTSDWHRTSIQTQDGSENLQNPLDGLNGGNSGFYGSSGTGPISGTETQNTKQFSQELRAASTGNGPLQWVVGVFFSDFKSDWQLLTTVPNPVAFGVTIPTVWSLTQPVDIRQYAVFGEATYALTKDWKITAGARWYNYDDKLSMYYYGFGGPTFSNAVDVQNVNQSNAGINPKFAVSYDASKELLLYASAARGFRPGGGNQPLPPVSNPVVGQCILQGLQAAGYANGVAPNSYGPDSVWSYEVGEKGRFLDNRLRVNTSFYYENWRDIQLEELPCDYPLYDNANTAHITGGEIEATALLGRNWILGGSAGVTHAVLAESSHGFHAGDRLPDVPNFTANLHIGFHAQVADTYEFLARLESSYTGTRVDLTFPGGVPDTQTPLAGYNLANLRLTLSADAGWQASLFVNNLANKRAQLENIAELTLANASYNRVETNQPRTIGVDVNYRF